MKVWESIACPKCGQPAGSKCLTATTRRVTDTHLARYYAEAKAIAKAQGR